MGLLKAILFFLFFYYAFKILAKWLAPILLRYAAKKTEKHFKEKFGQSQYTANVRDEERVGDVIIEKKPPTPRRPSSKKVGEYIDFEEIE